MKSHLLSAACAMAASLCAAPIELFVSPNGDDSNPGTREKPLATPLGARDTLRRVRSANRGALPPGGAVVVFADGEYHLSAPVALDKRDSGADGSPVVWRAANRLKATFSGAIKPSAWKVADEPAVTALLPESARGKVLVAELPPGIELPGFRGGGCGTPQKLQEIPLSLFQGGQRLEPARWPNEGYVRTGDNIGEAEKRHDAKFSRSGKFKFSTPRLEKWSREPELWTYGLWCYEWADAKARVLAIDPAAGIISVDPSPIGFGIKENAQFYVINAISEIDRPGEWAIDRARRRVYLWPTGPEPAIFAFSDGLFTGDGISDVTFEGLVLEYSRTTAMDFKNARRVNVLSSVFRHTSSWGVTVKNGTSCRVAGCDMYDLGEGGVALDGGDYKSLTPSRNVADNNHIHHYGRVVPNYRPGVRLLGVGGRCTHNLIHHTLHQAISFGGNDHYIGFNVCHDCCMFNDDAGTIYCCQRDWTKRGTLIERNIIHMTGKQPRATHTQGIYLDDFSSGVTMRGNIINRASLGIYIGGGQDCLAYGNVIMNCGKGIHVGSRGIETFARPISIKGRESEMFKRLEKGRALYEGALWKSRYPNMMRVFDFPDAQHAHDAHFNVVTGNVCVTSGSVSQSNEKFVHSTCTISNNIDVGEDPGFEDYPHFGWNLKPGPARDLVGDLCIDEIGLYESPLRASPPVKFGADVTPPRPLRYEYNLAMVRIDLPISGNLPEGITNIASECHRCDVPRWSRGKRVVASFGQASLKEWREYSFDFIPAIDGKLNLVTMGSRGEKTLYDDFRVEGAELKNGSFEEPKGWSPPCPRKDDYRAPMCNLEKPWGVLTAAEAGVPAADGDKMACGHDMICFSQPIKVKKGVRVTVTFKARALPIKE